MKSRASRTRPVVSARPYWFIASGLVLALCFGLAASRSGRQEPDRLQGLTAEIALLTRQQERLREALGRTSNRQGCDIDYQLIAKEVRAATPASADASPSGTAPSGDVQHTSDDEPSEYELVSMDAQDDGIRLIEEAIEVQHWGDEQVIALRELAVVMTPDDASEVMARVSAAINSGQLEIDAFSPF